MIIFANGHLDTLNYVVHHLLKIEVFYQQKDIEEILDSEIADVIEVFMPRYLFREQYSNTIRVFRELFHWTDDKFLHEMNAFHEVALFHFLCYMADLRERGKRKFDAYYFDKTCHDLIKASAKADFDNDEGRELSLEDYEKLYYDLGLYSELLFIDLDFCMIDLIYNDGVYSDSLILERLGINIDYYFEILPRDIQKKFATSHITLTGEVSSMINYIEERIDSGNLYKLFWEGGKPISEHRIQLIIENIMDAYFYKQEVEISRESLVGGGKVDFKLFKDNREEEKVLIEIKKARSLSYLKKGYEKQLVQYMLASKYKNAFYLIACFSDEEHRMIQRFISENIYTNTVQLYINISILDLRQRSAPSV